MRERMRRLLACLCLAACCPCCFPCYICAIRSRKRRRQQEEHEAIMEYQRVGPRSPEIVRPLRMGRRRRISIPPGVRRLVDEREVDAETETIENLNEKGYLVESLGEKQVMSDFDQPPVVMRTSEEIHRTTRPQSQSLLFRKLPPEIRSLIWRECVGNFSIYLGVIQDEKRIRHCKIFEGRGLMRLDTDQEEQNRLMDEHYFISLLQSCRRIYTEAIPLLYSTNTFLLSTPKTLLALSATTLPHRFNALTTLSIKYTPQLQHGLSFGLSAHDLKLWSRTADLLASMSSLRNLEITLWDRSVYGAPAEWENLPQVLGYLARVRQVRGRYVVALDQKGEGEKVDGLRELVERKRAPFELRFGPGDDGEMFFWLI